jgi:hypothetical protein
MQKIIVLFFITLLFSCMPKPEVSEQQRSQFEDCQKRLLNNKEAFIASGRTEAKKDSLREYITVLEQNNLDQLLEKYEVQQEELILFLYSVCEKADRFYDGPSMQDVLLSADSLQKELDSMIKADTIRKK